MPANTDKFTKSAVRFTTQIGAGGVADASVTTIPLSSVTNLPTDTAVFASIDRKDANGDYTLSKWEVVKGVISGTDIVTATRGVEGTAQLHSAGALVEIILTSSQWDDMIDGILAEHNQDGTHDSALVAMLAGAQTFSGAKTFSTAPLLTFGTEAEGDIFYGASDGTLTRLPKGDDGQVLTLASGVPAWDDSAGTSQVDEDNSGGSSTSSATAAAITGADVSVTLTQTSHVVLMANISAYQNSGSAAAYSIQWHDGTSLIGTEVRIDLPTGNVRYPVPIQTIVQSATSGSKTYTLYHRSQNGSASVTAETINLIAFSLPA